jgi:hypothetical protein
MSADGRGSVAVPLNFILPVRAVGRVETLVANKARKRGSKARRRLGDSRSLNGVRVERDAVNCVQFRGRGVSLRVALSRFERNRESDWFQRRGW